MVSAEARRRGWGNSSDGVEPGDGPARTGDGDAVKDRGCPRRLFERPSRRVGPRLQVSPSLDRVAAVSRGEAVLMDHVPPASVASPTRQSRDRAGVSPSAHLSLPSALCPLRFSSHRMTLVSVSSRRFRSLRRLKRGSERSSVSRTSEILPPQIYRFHATMQHSYSARVAIQHKTK